MISPQWRKVDELLDQAMDLSPAERTAFLDRECNGDTTLRREIESLLRAHEAASGFFDGGPASVAEDLIQNRQAEALTGRTIGHYQLMREIGRGGMGVVYEAVRADDQFRWKVAIKLLWPGMNNSEIARRFRHERQILANLDHPHIARLLDGGVTEDGLPYFAMEFIEGQPITDYCNAHKLPIAERLKLFQQVCSAVQYAHQNLIIHRDLKPGNILVTEDGATKLLDFGIAKLLDPTRHAITAQPTTQGLMMTPDYASPEQMRGEAITTASDVYSLGILLYELLSGGHPYRIKDRSLPELVRVVCEQEPEAPSERLRQRTEAAPLFGETKPERLRAQLRGDLDQITQTAIQKDSNLRYRSLEQLTEDLRRHAEGLPITARAISLSYRTKKFVRRNRVGVLAGVLLFLTLLGGIAATTRQARIAERERRRAEQQAAEAGRQKLSAETQAAEALRQKSLAETKSQEAEENSIRAEEQRQLAEQQQRLAEEQKTLALDQAERNRRLLYAAQMNLGAQAWETNNLRRVREMVDRYWPEPGKEDLRGFEWRYLWRLAYRDGELLNLEYYTVAWTLAFSPDGRKLAVGYNEPVITIWDAATGKELIKLEGHTRFIRGVAFSPDGKKLASASTDGTAKLWDLATGREIWTLKGHQGYVNAVAFSPDGQKLATGSRDNTWRLWDVATGRELLKIESRATWVNALAFSPDGKTLATGNGGGATVKLWEVATGKEKAAIDGQGAIWSIVFFSDGKRLATASKDRTGRVLDVQTGRELVRFREHTSEVLTVDVTSDGSTVATGAADRTLKFWDAATGKEIAALKADRGSLLTLSLSRDGTKIAGCSAGGHVKIWDLAQVMEFKTLSPKITRPGGEKFYSLAFSQDGSKLVTGGDTVRLWDVTSGREMALFDGNVDAVLAVRMTSDGNSVVMTDGRGKIKIRDSLTKKEKLVLDTSARAITAMSLSPDGQKLLSCGAPTARVWDINTGKELLKIENSGDACTFSPDGEYVALSAIPADRSVYAQRKEMDEMKVINVRTGQQIIALQGMPDTILVVAFSPDKKYLAYGTANGTVKVWQTVNWQMLATIPANPRDVRTLVFSPDGTRLATGSDEGLVRLWDIATKMDMVAFRGHTDHVRAVAFSPDGHTLASAGLDGTVRFWRAATKEEAAVRGRR